jgi:hypothetical protein
MAVDTIYQKNLFRRRFNTYLLLLIDTLIVHSSQMTDEQGNQLCNKDDSSLEITSTALLKEHETNDSKENEVTMLFPFFLSVFLSCWILWCLLF